MRLVIKRDQTKVVFVLIYLFNEVNICPMKEEILQGSSRGSSFAGIFSIPIQGNKDPRK